MTSKCSQRTWNKTQASGLKEYSKTAQLGRGHASHANEVKNKYLQLPLFNQDFIKDDIKASKVHRIFQTRD